MTPIIEAWCRRGDLSISASLAWCAGILVVFAGIAVARFSRTR